MPVLVVCAAVLPVRIGAVPAMLSGVTLAISLAWATLRLLDEPVRAALVRQIKARTNGEGRAARMMPQHHDAPIATLPGR